MKEMGGTQVKEAHAKMAEGSKELTKIFKDMTGVFGDAFEAITKFRGGLIAGVGGMAIFSYAVVKSIGEFKAWAEELRGIANAAKEFGGDAASMKNIISQFKTIGVEAEQTQSNLRTMADALANLSRQGSSLRRELQHRAGPTEDDQRNMARFIDQFKAAATEEERYNLVAEARRKVLESAKREGLAAGKSEQEATQEATNRANEFAGHFWDKSIANLDKLKDLSAEERKVQQERIDKAREFANLTGQIAEKWADIVEALKAPMLDPAIKAATAFLNLLDQVLVKIEQIKKGPMAGVEPITPQQGGAKPSPWDWFSGRTNVPNPFGQVPVNPMPQGGP